MVRLVAKICRRCKISKPLSEFYKKAGYRDGHRNECRACIYLLTKEYRRKNPEKARGWSESYRKKHLRQKADYEYARKQKKLGTFISPLTVLELEDGMCGLCKKDVDPLNFHVDHIIPLSKGGEHKLYNVQVAHPSCNMRKNNTLIEGTY